MCCRKVKHKALGFITYTAVDFCSFFFATKTVSGVPKPSDRSSVDDLRNQVFAHLPQGNLTKLQFQNAVGNVLVAFKTLGLPDV